MRKITVFSAAIAVGLFLMAATYAFAGVGIPSIPVGLEHDPAGIIARGVTDDRGNVTFNNLKEGSYTVVLPDTSRLKSSVLLTITTASGKLLATVPVSAGKKSIGPGYALDKSGRKLTVTIQALHKSGPGTLALSNGNQIVINLSIFDRWPND